METIEGMVNDIVFKNEENGYTIAHLSNENDDIVIVGCMPTISVGETLELNGRWINHKKYGVQFEVSNFIPVVPSSIEGIYVYLSSGMIHGIGDKMAKRIIKKFGVDALDIMQSEPHRLKEVEGIGERKLKKIIKSYEEDRELRNIIIKLSPFGITPSFCLKIYKRYKNDSEKIIKSNPYQLADEIRGIGFKVADKIASNLGINKNSKDRISQGIIYILNNSLNDGNSYLNKNQLIKESILLLEVDESLIEECVYDLVLRKKVHIERIDGHEDVYLMNYYLAENGVCSQIVKLGQYEFKDFAMDMSQEMKDIEEYENIRLAKNQIEAIQESISCGFLIITGGPGTGKTTTINSIIKLFEKNKKIVVLTAPTGRAAKRMSETTNREAKTIHRLLEMGLSTDDELVFFKNKDEPIKADVVIVDEVSMVDIILMYNLLSAVQVGTRVILVGDSDQLPSVGAGNVLKDMIDSQVINVIKLNEIFRQAKESMIIVNAHKINKGESLTLNAKDKDFYFIKKNSPEEIIREIVNLANKRLPNFYNVDKLKDIQVLSPMRKGDIGVNNLNIILQKYLNEKNNFKVEESFSKRILRVGDKVMQIKNNYTKKWETMDKKDCGEGIYNGDIGFVYNIDKEKKILCVLFDQTRIVEYEYDELDELEHSFCTTIHKSQGSEFPVVIIPITWAPPMLLSRNLLYTAVTRATKLVILVGQVKYLEYMIKNNKVKNRNSNLAYKLNKFKKEGLLITDK